MKRFKKILALGLSLAMVLGMSVTTFAAPDKPTAKDKGSITVTNIKDATATIKGYKIVKADYNTNGFAGYSKVDETDVFDIYEPKANEITVLAKKYSSKAADFEISTGDTKSEGSSITVDNSAGTYNYKMENLTVGTYLILVTGSNDVVYNPMVVSVSYQVEGENISGSWNEAEDGSVDAGGSWNNWGVTDAVVYAKFSEVTIKKEADSKTVNTGEVVKFTVVTRIPDYSAEYDENTLKFTITDTLHAGLKLVVSDTDGKPFVVETKAATDADTAYATVDNSNNSAYTPEGVNTDSTMYTVEFTSAWINTNKGKDVRITYYAKAEGMNVNATPFQNDIELTYTHSTETGTGGEKKTTDTEYVYTFDLKGVSDANATGFVEKVKTEEGEKKPLGDAEFTLYTDAACKVRYTNTDHPENDVNGNVIPTTVSDQSTGEINIRGLATGTYYLKETKAPAGYSLTDKVFRIIISVDEENGYNKDANGKKTTLKSWTVKVAEVTVDMEGNVTVAEGTTEATYTFNASSSSKQEGDETVVTWTSTAAEGNSGTTQIENTKLSSLPSTGGIGTTIFTIGGCAIMILAAGLYFASRRKSAR